MKKRIVLFGATGFTGRLVAESMAGRGLTPVLAGRSRDKLDDLAARLGGLETAVADVSLPSSVAGLVGKGDTLVSTVGPFTLHGGAALEAAVVSGAHYFDSTGEPGFIRKAFEDYGPRAGESGATLVTACGYDYVPGNCAAGAALRAAGEGAVRVDVGYFFKGVFDMSQGTRASTRVAALDSGRVFESGRLVERPGAFKVREFEVGGKDKAGISISSTEHYSLPRSYPRLTDVNVYLGWFGKRSYAMQKAARFQAGLMKVPGVTALLKKLVSLGPESKGRGPDADARAKSGSHIVAEAFNASGEMLARAELIGANGYDFTADMMAWMAEMAAEGKLKGAGALGPVEAFGLDELIGGCKQAGLELSLEEVHS